MGRKMLRNILLIVNLFLLVAKSNEIKHKKVSSKCQEGYASINQSLMFSFGQMAQNPNEKNRVFSVLPKESLTVMESTNYTDYS